MDEFGKCITKVAITSGTADYVHGFITFLKGFAILIIFCVIIILLFELLGSRVWPQVMRRLNVRRFYREEYASLQRKYAKLCKELGDLETQLNLTN